MATMYPRQLPDRVLSDTRRRAEVAVFDALRDQLPGAYHVFYSRAWAVRGRDGRSTDGEADFVIAHAERPVLLMEVKGGRIGYDGQTDRWTSTDRDGVIHDIDPVRQLRGGKHALIEVLKRVPAWRGRWVDIGHCVAFAQSGYLPGAETADLPATLVLYASDLHHIEDRIEQIQRWWVDGQNLRPMGDGGVRVLRGVLAPTFELAAPVGPELAEVDRRILELTEEQFDLLEMLKANERVAVAGGAGTGKTLLAMEKARRLAGDDEGPLRTLLVCYNRPLAEFLSSLAPSACQDNLTVTTFHSLCADFARQTGQRLSDPDAPALPQSYFEHDLPMALLEAVADKPDLRFDAIIVDEGQDFPSTWWTALELAATRGSEGLMYVFYDNNQRIYQRPTQLPKGLVPATLTRNLRNTRPIFDVAKQFYRGEPAMRAAGPSSGGVQLIEVATERAALDMLSRSLHELVRDGGVRSDDVVVLVGRPPERSFVARQNSVGAFRLAADDDQVAAGRPNTIRVSSIHRFKGLERRVVILMDAEGLADELMYVALTRARAHLIVIGSSATLARLSAECAGGSQIAG